MFRRSCAMIDERPAPPPFESPGNKLERNCEGHDDVLALAGMRGEPIAEDLLRVAVGVEVCGVDEVAAAIEIGPENLLGFLDAAAGSPGSSPKVIAPSANGLTRRPDRPSVT